MAESHLDLIARIHAGFEAQARLAASLTGRTVAVRGATHEEWLGLEPDLRRCGATTVRVLLPEVEALVAGSQVQRPDVLAAAERGLTLLRPSDVALIAATHRRVTGRSERAYREAIDRALADAQRLVAERERRATTLAAASRDAGAGLHIRSR